VSDNTADDFFESDISEEIKKGEDEQLEPLLKEINLIEDHDIRSFTRAMLLKADKFWYIPSSNQPGFYPPDEMLTGGLLLHTKRVFRCVEILCVLYQVPQSSIDQLKAAALLHDITKPIGVVDNDAYLYDYLHPYTVDALYYAVKHEDELSSNSVQSNVLTISDEAVNNILKAVRSHRGVQSPIPETHPAKDSLPMLLHVANEMAKSLHYLVDGEEVLLERWIAMNEDGEQE
jgi:23S rRNA maturation-related 3'-5' exoribonuclease YhaM